MISNPDGITRVIRGESEYFFLYRDKYKWSIRKDNEGAHTLWFYPGDESLEVLASYSADDWEHIDMVVYRDAEIGTKEARATFAELYNLVRERLFNVNKALDDIIADADRS